MPTVRVTCPECDFTFSIADSRVGGLITCRDCKAEFRVEFAEDEADEREEPARRDDRDDRPPPKSKTASRTNSRMDADHEPEGWKSDLPLRSPVPLLIFLVGLQALVAVFLVLNWFFPAGSASVTPTTSYYSPYSTAPKPAGFTPTTSRK